MAGDELKIGITAELANFRAAMATLPGIGEQEARDMVRGIQRQLKEAEKAAKASAKQIADDAGKGLEGLGDAAGFVKEKFNETFGLAGELLTDFLTPLGSATTGMGGFGAAVGAAGIGAAGAAVAVGLYVGALKTLSDSAIEARDRMIEQGRAAEIPPDSIKSLELYEAASHELSAAMDELSVIVGGAVADDLAVLVHTTSEWVRWASDAASSTGDWVREFHGLVSLGLSEYLYEWRDGVKAVAEEEIKAAEETRKWREANKEWREETEQMLVMLGLLVEETEPVVESHQQKTEAIDAEKAALEDMLRVADEVSAAEAVRVAAAQERADLFEQAIEAERQAYLQAFRDKQQARQQEMIEEQERADLLKSLALQLAESTLQSTQSLSSAIVAGYERRAAEGEKLSQKEKAAAVAAFEVSQGAAVAAATLAAVQIGVNTVNQLTSVGMPFPAALPLGLAATGTVLAGQVAQIEQASPPEFPLGLSPDHRMVGLQDEELVANRRASRMPEVREAIRKGNRGERPSSPAREREQVEVHVSLDPRLKRLRVEAGRVGKKPFRRRG